MGRVTQSGVRIRRPWLSCALLLVTASPVVFLDSCTRPIPIITFDEVPVASLGGAKTDGIIRGHVSEHTTKDHIVLYSRTSSAWWVQPSATIPFTDIKPDGTWGAHIHLGMDYAAIMVTEGFSATTVVKRPPDIAGPVRARAITPANSSLTGAQVQPSKTIQFGGYDWQVRNVPGGYGGADHYYSTDNLWLAADGTMHLRLAKVENRWICSEAHTVRSLGYGSYRFTLRDVSALPNEALFSIFTWSDTPPLSDNREMDIHVSRWGNAESTNAEYVIQPYYLPANGFRFEMPRGRVVTGFRWDRSLAQFMSSLAQATGDRTTITKSFSNGIPSLQRQQVFVNLCEFNYSRKKLRDGAEVVIEKFEFLP